MNSAKQCVNSEPCEVTVHAQKKKKKKKGRKRGRSKTPGNAQAKHSLSSSLNLGENWQMPFSKKKKSSILPPFSN